jgi:hypothetical protein
MMLLGMIHAGSYVAGPARYLYFHFGGGGKKERKLLGRIDPASFLPVKNHIIHWVLPVSETRINHTHILLDMGAAQPQAVNHIAGWPPA